MDKKTFLLVLQLGAGLFIITIRDVELYIGPVYSAEDSEPIQKGRESTIYVIWAYFILPYVPVLLSPFVTSFMFRHVPVKFALIFGAGVLVLYLGLFIIPLPKSYWDYLVYMSACGEGIVKTALEYLLLSRLNEDGTNLSESDSLYNPLKLITGFWIGYQGLYALSRILGIYIVTLRPVVTEVREEKFCSWSGCSLSNTTTIYVGEMEDSSRSITITVLSSLAFVLIFICAFWGKLPRSVGETFEPRPSLKTFLICFKTPKFTMLLPIMGYSGFFKVSILTALSYTFDMSRYAPTGDEHEDIKNSLYSFLLSGALFGVGNMIGSLVFINISRSRDTNLSIYLGLCIHTVVHVSLLIFFFVHMLAYPYWGSRDIEDNGSILASLGFGAICIFLGVGEALLNIQLYNTIRSHFKGSLITTLIFWKAAKGIFILGFSLIFITVKMNWRTLWYYQSFQRLSCVFAVVSIGIVILGGIFFEKGTKLEVESGIEERESIPMSSNVSREERL